MHRLTPDPTTLGVPPERSRDGCTSSLRQDSTNARSSSLIGRSMHLTIGRPGPSHEENTDGHNAAKTIHAHAPSLPVPPPGFGRHAGPGLHPAMSPQAT